jgi:hypothetical protein
MWAGFLIDHFNYQTYTTNLSEDHLRLELYNRVKRYNKLIESYYYDMQGTLLKIEEVRLAIEKEMKLKEIEPTVKFEEVKVELKPEEEEAEFDELLNDL